MARPKRWEDRLRDAWEDLKDRWGEALDALDGWLGPAPEPVPVPVDRPREQAPRGPRR